MDCNGSGSSTAGPSHFEACRGLTFRVRSWLELRSLVCTFLVSSIDEITVGHSCEKTLVILVQNTHAIPCGQ